MTSKTNAAASGTVSRFGAKYDALGRRIETSRSGSAFAQNFVSDYQYDLLGQLTKDERFAGETRGDPAAKLEAQSFGFLYDGIGNRLTAQKGTDTTAYVPNALNQYTSIGAMQPVHDADGNLFSDGKNRFHWDAENRLILVEPLVPTEGSKRLEFKYDYIGRRVSKQVWTHTGGSWTDESTTAFVYDGWNLIEEVSTSSHTASINHYTWGLDLSGSLQGAGGVGGLLSVVCAPFTESGLIGDWLLPIGYVPLALSGVEGPAPSTFHYTFDLNGNVSELIDSTGTIAAHYEYGPFGETLVEYFNPDLRSSISDIRFSTKYYDAELETYYYGYRYYDPETGRWLNRDPIEEDGGLNLYGFVGNDGVNRWDLWGMVDDFEMNCERYGKYDVSLWYYYDSSITQAALDTSRDLQLVIKGITGNILKAGELVLDDNAKREYLKVDFDVKKSTNDWDQVKPNTWRIAISTWESIMNFLFGGGPTVYYYNSPTYNMKKKELSDMAPNRIVPAITKEQFTVEYRLKIDRKLSISLRSHNDISGDEWVKSVIAKGLKDGLMFGSLVQ